MGNPIRALHVHDAAHVGRNLVETARSMDYPWEMTDIPWYYRRSWTGLLKHPAARTKPALWDSTLALQSVRADVVHLHTGGLSTHMRWVRRPWVLHLHGTDIRTRQYEASWRPKLQYGTANASAVLYATPDLLPHVLKLRSDPVYMPITVRLDETPFWSPVTDRVIFASRWEKIKGAPEQLDTARRIKAERPGAELLGIDWGDQTEEARAAGVTLVPKMSRDDYRTWLASASAVVGQMTDIYATSELEALAAGVPVVSSADHNWYPELSHLCGRTPADVAAAAVRVLEDPRQASRRQDGPGYIAKVHDAGVGVRTLLALYSTLTGGDQG
ncbi:glycosyltransferase [Arthrobacter sp. H5]|uniref:glycosyltransferase n=1 Tax=Arthrobacter sp. H5 TaxID=1267973 RepID=UPI001C1E2862|nr:glycosyltransferase [Arthrobacter sp. H5]